MSIPPKYIELDMPTRAGPKAFYKPSMVLPAPAIKPAAKARPAHEFCIKLSMSSIEGRPLSVSLARVEDKDSPLIGCSLGFLALSGLTRAQCLGRNCRFLNTGLSMPHRESLRSCVKEGKPFMGVLDNVRSLGRGQTATFQNLLHLAIIPAGRGSYIIGLQADVTGLELDLAASSKDAVRLQKMFDAVLSAGVDSWVHLQEGMCHCVPVYLHIRQGWQGDDEILIEEEIERTTSPLIRWAPDQCMVLAPRFPRAGSGDTLKWRFMGLHDYSEPILEAPAQGPPGLSAAKVVESEPRLLSLATALPSHSGRQTSSDLLRQTSSNETGSDDDPFSRQTSGESALTTGSLESSPGSLGGYDASSGADTKASSGEEVNKWSSTIKNQLRALNLEDPACVMSARGISKLGMSSAEILSAHFTQYGQVKAVHIPFVHKKRSKEPRSAGRGFIVMELSETVSKILTEGSEHTVDGVKVLLEPFSAKASDEKANVD